MQANTFSGMFSFRLGSVRRYSRRVATPQIFGVILLLLVASFRVEDSAALFARYFTFLGYLVASAVALVFVYKRFTFLALFIELSGALALLYVLELIVPLSPLLCVYAPLCCLALSLHFLPLLWKQKLIAVSLFLPATVLPLLTFHSVRGIELGILLTVLLFALSILLLRRSLELKPQPSPRTVAIERKDVEQRLRESSQNASGDAHTKESTNLIRVAERVFRREYLAELSWHLAIFALLVAAVVLAIPFVEGVKNRSFALAWLVVTVTQMLIHYLMLRQQSSLKITRLALVLYCTILFWWGLLGYYHLIRIDFLIFGFALLFLCAGMIPVSGRLSSFFYLLLTSFAVVLSSYSPSPFVAFSFFFVVLLVSFRNSLTSYRLIVTRAGGLILSRVVESSSARGVLTLLGWVTRRIASASRIVMVFGGKEVKFYSEQGEGDVVVDAAHLQALLQAIEETGSEGGVLDQSFVLEKYSSLVEQFFRTSYQRLFFLKMTTVLGEKEESIHIFAPVTFWAAASSVEKLFRGLYTVASIVKIAFSASRRRFRTSDVLRTAQRSASERELEFNQVVHRVNNIAQDMTISCDAMGRILEADEMNIAHLQDEVAKQRLALRALFSGVSDVKILRELMHLKKFERTEEVRVDSVLQEVLPYAQYLSQHLKQTFEVNLLENDSKRFEVVSREFLEACLRLAFHVIRYRLGDNGCVSLSVTFEDDNVLFSFCDDGRAWSSEERTLLSQTGAEGSMLEHLRHFAALTNLAQLSHGSVELLDPKGNDSLSVSLVLRFRLAAEKQQAVVSDTGWLLLVDDSPEVSTFYSRVADALQLSYYTADCLEKAKEIVSREGQPRLVVSDIQLPDGSGLDLVRHLRSQFGNDLPIIVVSGNTEGGLSDTVREAGADKFLSKPVGRRKLLVEVQELLRL